MFDNRLVFPSSQEFDFGILGLDVSLGFGKFTFNFTSEIA
jgi:hypothetical protein